MAPRSRKHGGFTLIELIVATTILLILTGLAIPAAKITIKREKERQLHHALWEMRDAIDRYKDAADRNLIRVEAGSEGYPPDLDTLVKGVNLASQQGAGIAGATPAGQVNPAAGFGGAFGLSPGGPGGAQQSAGQTFGQGNSTQGQDLIRHVRFLRRVPVDPMTGHAEWGMRSVQDDPDSTSWGGKNVFDVFSLASGTALDGTKYGDW